MAALDPESQLRRWLPVALLERLTQIRQLAESEQTPLYVVGGFVRDSLLGLTPDDFDLVVEGDAPALARAAAREWGGVVTVHAPFGTAVWRTPDGAAIDFASARTETYPAPAVLPVVSVPATIEADLSRRDFAINALALRLDGPRAGERLDPFHGQADLRARTVRVLHLLSFRDDPTRVFRAVRYEQRLGFQIAAETLALISDAPLESLTSDRLRHEFELIFREPRTVAMLARLSELGVLQRVHPALKWDERGTQAAAAISRLPWRDWRMNAAPEPDALFWAVLLREAGLEATDLALARLNLNRAEAEAVRESVALRRTWARPSEAVAVLDSLSELGVIAAYVARLELRDDLHLYLSRWRFVRPTITGADLIARGLTPGPYFKRWLWTLRAAWLDGTVTDAASEQSLLEALTRAGTLAL
jgi:tRNA nucleotidyltransferase (CCA-adding enzyme)